MKKIDIVEIAFTNFKRRKTRSMLTVLGVVIGVASIVVMVSLGIAVNVYFEKQTAEMGDLTMIRVYPGYDSDTGQQKNDLTDELVATIQGIDKVTAVSPEISVRGKMGVGKYVSDVNITGVTSELLGILGFEAEEGTLNLNAPSVSNIQCLFGSEIPYHFYNPRARRSSGAGMMMGGMMIGGGGGEEVRPEPDVDLMAPESKVKFTFDWSYGEKKNPSMDNQPIKKPKLYKVEPVGVLKESMSQKDYTVYVDLETARLLKKEEEKYRKSQGGGMGGSTGSSSSKKKDDSYDQIMVITDSLEHTTEVAKILKDQYGLQASSGAEYISGMKNISNVLQLILGGIGSISLLVAAIGITNTMIMSIYERTKEIGVMKVIGCQLKDIRSMFLYEAAFIGLFGGAIGLIISYMISFCINLVTKMGGDSGGGMGGMGMGGDPVQLSIIPPWLALVAVLFAIGVGLLSGYLPARRAMKLSALEAMKN